MDIVIAMLLALAGGAVGGLLGVGGGILFVPALAVFLGSTQIEAEATSLLVIVPMAIVGTWRQHRHGNVDLRDGITIGLLSVPGVIVGVVVANALSQRALELGFAGLSLVVAAKLLQRAFSGNRAGTGPAAGSGLGRFNVSDVLDIGHGIAIPVAEVEVRASRSGGPGGQHANKTASRIEATFDVRASPSLTDAQKARIAGRLGPRVTAVAQDTRGQARNREIALERLRSRLAGAVAPRKQRRATRPGRASKEKRLHSKRRQSERKRDRRRPSTDD